MIAKVGDAIGPFTLVKLLGQGGMGAVFVARHQNGVECALKVLLDPDPAILERFKREIAAMGRVDRHPGVVRVHTAGTFGPQALPYVVMDLVRGSDLSKEIGGRPMEPARAADMVARIADALEFCHAKGVIHRDLKPANVLVRADDGQPVVTDFGLARDDTAERLTKTGEVLGTPAYMAPEQLEGDRTAQDRRTDVYALGAILYECLTGEPPFKADTPTRLMKMVLIDDPADPRRKVRAVPVDLSVIALKCLAKQRERRYQSAKGVAEELRRFLANEPILARPETSAERNERWKRNHRVEWLLRRVVAITLVAGAGVAAWYWFAPASIDEETERLQASARLAGFPALHEKDQLRTDVKESIEALCRKAGAARVAEDRDVRRLDLWVKLAVDRPRTLAALEPGDDPLVQSLAAAAAVRQGDAALRERVAKALPDGRAKKLLALHGKASLRDLLAAEGDLDPDSKVAWRGAVVLDLERATRTAVEAETLDREALVRVIKFVEPFADKSLLASVAGWLGARGWTALYKDKERKPDAHRLLEKLDAKVIPAELVAQIAEGISAAIVEQIPEAATGKRFDLHRVLPDLIDIERLRGLPSDAVIDKIAQLAGDKGSAFFDKDGEATMRSEVLAVLVAAGMMPAAEKQLRPSRRTAEKKEKRGEAARRRAHLAENLAKEHPKVPLVRLVAALGMMLVAIELDKLHGYDPSDPTVKPAGDVDSEKLYVAASRMFEEARGELESPYAIAFASYERAWLLLRGALRAPGIKPGRPGMHDPEQLRKVLAQLDATKQYSRPWALQEFRVEVEYRHLERVTEDIYRKTRPHKLLEGNANPNAENAVASLPETKAAFGRVMTASETWRAGLDPVLVEAEALQRRSGGDGAPLDAREARRHIELANLYVLQRQDASAEITKLRSNARRRLAYVAKFAGDEETTKATASEGEKELLEAARANPQKVTFRQDRVEFLVLLGRRDEARALNEEVLNDRTLGELDGNDRTRAEDWREILK